MKLIAIFTILFLAIVPFTLQAQTQTQAPEEHGAKLLDAAFAQAMNANNVDGIVALYAPNAIVYPPDAMQTVGRDAIRAMFTAFFAANTVKGFHTMGATYETHGDISLGWGRWMMTVTPKAGGAEMNMEGRFTEIAKKSPDGKWFLVVDHGSVPLPATTQTQTSTTGK
jgi:uncharacterized protein (TIGR02246 family)